MLDENGKSELFLELSNKQQQFVRGGDSPFVIIYDLGGNPANPAANPSTGTSANTTSANTTPATTTPYSAVPTLNLPAIPGLSFPAIPALSLPVVPTV
jgi:hypothetical protein